MIAANPNFLTQFSRRPLAKYHAFVTANASKTANLIVNISYSDFYALKLPTIEELEEIVAESERAILEDNWKVCITDFHQKRSPSSVAIRTSWLEANGFPFNAKWTTQKKFLRKYAPVTLAQARESIRASFLRERGPVALRPSENSIKDSNAWLEHFNGLFAHKPTDSYFGWASPMWVASELRRRKCLLFSRSGNNRLSRSLARKARVYRPPQVYREKIRSHAAPLIKGINIESLSRRKQSDLYTHSLRLALCSNLESASELTWAYVDYVCHRVRESADKDAGQEERNSSVLRAHLFEIAKTNGKTALIDSVEDTLLIRLKARSGSRWEELGCWRDAFSIYTKNLAKKTVSTEAYTLGFLIDWLLQNSPAVLPSKITREHITGANMRSDTGLIGFIGSRKLVNGTTGRTIDTTTKNRTIKAIDNFFSRMVNTEWGKVNRFVNHIHYNIDKFDRTIEDKRTGSATHRKRIDSYVLDELIRFLIVRTADGYAWSPWASTADIVRVGNDKIGCPILPGILYILLKYPLRTNQAIWLDSGELDEMVYDPNLRKSVPNKAAHAIRGRCMGVLQPALEGTFEKEGNDLKLDLQVALNKRPLGDPTEYTIPFVDEETVWVITNILDWQKKHGLPPTLVNESESPSIWHISKNNTSVAQLQQLTCLFRHPRARGLFPPGANLFRAFWIRVCRAYDKQNSEWRDPRTGVLQTKPGAVALSKPSEQSGLLEAIYDPHSLRVSGISALLDRGLTLEHVGAIAGHRSVLMTLHYYVADRKKLRKRLSEVLRENPNLASKVSEIEERVRKIENHKEWLAGSSIAFSKLQEAIRDGGNLNITLTGICPGTKCAEGLPGGTARESQLVPGCLCGLCRFRLYGPPFLPGLIQEFNHTITALTHVAYKQNALRKQWREAEDSGNYDHAILCRNEDAELILRSAPDSAHAVRLCEMIRESIALLAPGHANQTNTTLIAQIPTIRAVVESVGSFEHMKEILDCAVLLPANKSTIPDQISPAFQNKLLGLLARNGKKPFLANLPSEIAKIAAMQFADLLEKTVPKSEEREALFNGEMLLSNLGIGSQTRIDRGLELIDTALSNSGKSHRLK